MDYKLKKSRSYFQKSSTQSYKPIQDQVLGFLSEQRQFKNKTFDSKLIQTQCTVLLWRPSPHIWVKKNISCFKSSDPAFLYFPMFTQKIRLMNERYWSLDQWSGSMISDNQGLPTFQLLIRAWNQLQNYSNCVRFKCIQAI